MADHVNAHFPYRPIHYSEKEGLDIHLVMVFPGPADEPIKCHLIYQKLYLSKQDTSKSGSGEIAVSSQKQLSNDTDEDVFKSTEKSLSYEALSYTWGDASKRKIISLEGEKFYITANLEEALRNFTQSDRVRNLWIDAICIDQNNVSERNEMIFMMRDIYRLARRVIIWLGPTLFPLDPDDADSAAQTRELVKESWPEPPIYRAFDLVTKLANAHRELCKIHNKDSPLLTSVAEFETYRKFLDSSRLLSISRHQITSKEARTDFYCLRKLLSLSWFRRVWVLEEAAAATVAEVSCGIYKASWEDFLLADMCILCFVAWADPALAKIVDDTCMILWFSQANLSYRGEKPPSSPGFALYSLLRITRRFDATDPRDKIYAMLGLLPPNISQHIIQPDYNSSVHDVYADFVRKVLLSSHDLSLLCLCDGHNMRIGEEDVSGWESWIPTSSGKLELCLPWEEDDEDFEMESSAEQYRLFAAGTTRSQVSASDDSSVLKVQGYIYAAITHIGDYLEIKNPHPEGQVDAEEYQKQRIRKAHSVIQSWADATKEIIGQQGTNPYGSRQDIEKAFAESILEDISMMTYYHETENKLQQYESFQQFNIEAEQDPSIQPTAEKISEMSQFVSCVNDHAGSCRLLITDSGHFGFTVASHKAQVGDQLCILLGGPMPFILRNSEDHHRLVGRCWIQGLMKGEAMAGLEKDPSNAKSIMLK